MTVLIPEPSVGADYAEPFRRLEELLSGRGEERLLADLLRRLIELYEWKIPRSSKPLGLRDITPSLMERVASLMHLESEIELDMDRLLVKEGIASEFKRGRTLLVPYIGIAGEIREGDTYPDLLHVCLPLAIYCDGHEAHSSVPQREKDYGVSNALQARGYRVLRFSGQQIQRHPVLVVNSVRQAMRALKRSRDGGL